LDIFGLHIGNLTIMTNTTLAYYSKDNTYAMCSSFTRFAKLPSRQVTR
jgi:hypothetical protein